MRYENGRLPGHLSGVLGPDAQRRGFLGSGQVGRTGPCFPLCPLGPMGRFPHHHLGPLDPLVVLVLLRLRQAPLSYLSQACRSARMLCLALSDIRDPSTPGYHCLGAYVLSFCHYSGLRTWGMLVVALHMTMAYCRVLRSRQDPFPPDAELAGASEALSPTRQISAAGCQAIFFSQHSLA